MKIIRNFLLVLMLPALAQACASPANNIDPLDPNLISTVVAGTSAAAATQTAQAPIPITGGESSTPTLTKVPSSTPFPTFTPVTLGMVTPLVRVSRNTNCRSGPGEVYDKVGALLVGDAAEVVGRSADAQYWIIRNPNRPSTLCWLSGKYATVTGVAGALPVFTAPPPPTATRTPTRVPPTRTFTPVPSSTSAPTVPTTPTFTFTPMPGFTAAYSNLENCSGTDWWVDFQLQNTGGMTFESIFMSVKDTVTNTTLSSNSDDFINNDCTGSDTQDNLPIGATRIVSSPVFTDNLTGHALEAAITVCSNPGQTGTCVSKVINFTP